MFKNTDVRVFRQFKMACTSGNRNAYTLTRNHTHSHMLLARSLTHSSSNKKKAECGADKVFIFRRQYDARYYVRIVNGVESASPDIVCIGPRKAEILKTKKNKKATEHRVCIAQGGFFLASTCKKQKCEAANTGKAKVYTCARNFWLFFIFLLLFLKLALV